MVQVGRVGGAPAAVAARRGAPSTGFSVASQPAAGQGAAQAAAATAALDGMLLLQEVEDAPLRDRQARRHGRAMLEALAALQHALLAEGEDDAALGRLAALVESCPEAADPGLRGLLGAVALRARVELARRGV